ncbi:MAG: hypothetical protein J6A38_05885 [Clostridia bacterium]|nr:hypothetical protein [Clostridia bacterium]
MEIFGWLGDAFQQSTAFTAIVCVASGALVIAGVAGYVLKNAGYYGAIALMTCGGVCIAILSGGVGWRAGVACLSLLAIFGGGVYLALYSVLAVRKHILARRKRREEITRQLQFTLPDRENAFVRSRLQTALHVDDERLEEVWESVEENALKEKKEKSFRVEYAYRLLAKVKTAPLSVAERLQTDEMSKTLAVYMQKERWTANDLRVVNELFAGLLKLSAKYAV